MPKSTNVNKANGSALTGRFSDRNSAPGSHVNPNATIQSTTAIETPVVVHGSRIAMSAATRSTLSIRAAGSFRADQIVERQEISASFPTASVIYSHPLVATAARAELAHAAVTQQPKAR